MSDIKPALTAEEWDDEANIGAVVIDGGRIDVVNNGRKLYLDVEEHGRVADLREKDRHALAAICLYNQPFGFTREDVKLLRHAEKKEMNYWFKSLADRIEALLPPEETASPE